MIIVVRRQATTECDGRFDIAPKKPKFIFINALKAHKMQPFLNLTLDVEEWSALRRGRFTKSERALDTQYLGR
jgi:hypothetical protein